MKNKLEKLQLSKKSFYLTTNLGALKSENYFLNKQGKKEEVIRFIKGENCKNKESLLIEFASSLEFPDYFNFNWDSFEECINDLSWLPGNECAIIITNFNEMLIDNSTDLKIFIDILKKVVVKTIVNEDSKEMKIIFQCNSKYKNVCRNLLLNNGVEV